jgi:alkanesulfonate monooxygenase SsuD/methylene tetrahydromethanopterin reductase-like flavin-dependent oxidoreductase (luciferase family)
MAMHIAHITEHIRIGMAVSLAAFYHPLRLAEEVALLDVLSGGRVNWGAGRGFDKREFGVFGVPPDESYPRFRECVEIVLAAWSNDKLNYQGKFWNFEDIEVLPKPQQDPLPYWIASSSPDAIEWSASKGHPILMDPHAPHESIAGKYQAYLAGLAEHGHADVAEKDTPIARLVAIAATDAEAEAVARNGAQWTVGSYANKKTSANVKRMNYGEAEEPLDRVQQYVDQVIIHGSPAKVIDELQRLEEEVPLNYLMAAPLSHESFVRLTDEVIPKIA